ncbi:hypothetical protein HDU98_011996 [Podochytrium sp. JEL0797]|nr:hypothetical protein HDU98_011996 [Podochytrium sp. JEL0797]
MDTPANQPSPPTFKDIVQYKCEVMRLKDDEPVMALEGVVTRRQHEAVWNCKPILRRFRV